MEFKSTFLGCNIGVLHGFYYYNNTLEKFKKDLKELYLKAKGEGSTYNFAFNDPTAYGTLLMNIKPDDIPDGAESHVKNLFPKATMIPIPGRYGNYKTHLYIIDKADFKKAIGV